MRHRQRIEIERPVEEVFGYVTDPANLPEWDEDIRRGEKLTSGPIGPGTRIEIERTLPPSRNYGTLRGKITEYRPSDSFAVIIDEGPMPFDLRYDFAGRGDATELSVSIQSHPVGARRILEALLAPLIRRQVAAHYVRLKRVLEASSGSPPRAARA